MLFSLALPFVIRLVKTDQLRAFLIIFLLAQLAIGIGVYLIKPYQRHRSPGWRDERENIVVNRTINWMLLISCVTFYAALLSKPTKQSILRMPSWLVLLLCGLLLAGFYWWSLTSLKRLDPDERYELYESMGFYG